MKYNQLGNTGLLVSELCFGTMTFSGKGFWKAIGLLVWSPLAGGLLSGKFSREGEEPDTARRESFDFPPVDKDRAFNVLDVMWEVAEDHGVSIAQIALTWLLHQPVVTSVIIGAKNEEQLSDDLAAPDVHLSDEELSRLDDISALPPEYPGWMLERQAQLLSGTVG